MSDRRLSTTSQAQPSRTRPGKFAGSSPANFPTPVRLLNGRELLDTSGGPHACLARLADLQRGRVKRSQLLAVGWTPDMIRTALRRGSLRQVTRGVYAVGHLAAVPHAREAAALLAVERGVLAGLSVLAFHGLTPTPADVHVAATTSKSRSGIRVHRYALTRQDIRISDGLPMTTAERALLDSAPYLADRQLEQAVDEALYRRLTSRTKLRELSARNPGHSGQRRLRQLLDPHRRSSRTESPPHELALGLLRQANLPEPPETEVELWGFRVDIFFPQARVAVEVDAFGSHGQIRRNFHRDRRKDRVLRAHGILVIRVTDAQLTEEPLAFIADVASSVARRLVA